MIENAEAIGCKRAHTSVLEVFPKWEGFHAEASCVPAALIAG
jgi:hypothetical protein